MGSVAAYSTARGKRHKVQYRKPDHSSTSKRGFLTKREATLFLASVEVSMSRGAYVDPTRSRITVGDWMDQWMAARTDLRASTLDRIEGIIRRNIKPALGNVALADLRRMLIQEWASSLSTDQSAASVRKIGNTLSGALQLAVDDGRIPTNPASRLKLTKVAKISKRYLDHQQIHELAEAVDARGSGYGLVILALSYGGLRWGELAGLTVGDVDLKRGRLEVRHTMIEINGYLEESTPKTYEERSIPVPRFVLEQLAEAIDGRAPSEHVFVGGRGAAVLRNRVFRRHFLSEVTAEIGLPGLTPYLRESRGLGRRVLKGAAKNIRPRFRERDAQYVCGPARP